MSTMIELFCAPQDEIIERFTVRFPPFDQGHFPVKRRISYFLSVCGQYDPNCIKFKFVMRFYISKEYLMLRIRSVCSFAKVALSSIVLLGILAGCSNTKKTRGPGYTGSIKRISPSRRVAISHKAPPKASPLAKKATKLSAEFKKNPGNSQVALNYIYHLRSLGMGQRAVSILHQAYQANPRHPVIASEYGRLLLGSGKTVQAARVLNRINANAKQDWHTLSALGTIEARNGSYDKATNYFRQARVLAPKKASILNNLALSIALGGKPDEAENLLRNADDSGRFGARLRQNLALVLALQGKYEEAQAMATTDLTPAQARTNIAYLKRMLSTSNSSNGIELTDETAAPVARVTAENNMPDMDEAPETTASIGAPMQLIPEVAMEEVRSTQN
jgi:Flp pilus assembly protein TadD